MTPAPKLPNVTVQASASSSCEDAKESQARRPKPLRRWSVAELIAGAAVRRSMMTVWTGAQR
jgi:hypothetical protein